MPSTSLVVYRKIIVVCQYLARMGAGGSDKNLLYCTKGYYDYQCVFLVADTKLSNDYLSPNQQSLAT